VKDRVEESETMSDRDAIPRKGEKVTFREDSCFVCGKLNPIGFHLAFDLDEENRRATSRVVFKDEHQGWDGIVHGGLLGSVLDDVMAYAIMTTGRMGITTRLCVTYRKPVMVGETLHLEGSVEKLTKRLAIARGVGYTLPEAGKGEEERSIRVVAEGTYYLDSPKGG
jgi:uncharacterized protein (TIGR00369 family)